MRYPLREPLLHTWDDLIARRSIYLDAVREPGASLTVRMGRTLVRLGRRGLAGGGTAVLTVMASELEDRRREMRAHLDGGGVVELTRWGIVDGVLEVVE